MLIKKKKTEPKLEYLQDPKTLEIPESMKPLYETDEILRQHLQDLQEQMDELTYLTLKTTEVR